MRLLLKTGNPGTVLNFLHVRGVRYFVAEDAKTGDLHLVQVDRAFVLVRAE